MNRRLHQFSFPGEMLVRGFWLYVWKITTDKGRMLLYIGRTGDSSSLNAQSPFARISQRLGSNKHANTLRRHLDARKIKPEQCRSFELIAYGPIRWQASTKKAHRSARDHVASLEKSLCDELTFAGYAVLNNVKCRKRMNQKSWKTVRKAFALHFDRLDKAILIRQTITNL